jgi:hypothetical protein
MVRAVLDSFSPRLPGCGIAVIVVLALASGDALAKKPKKNKGEDTGPKIGWQNTGSGQCWVAPDFSKMPEGTKRMAWQETRDAIVSQWRGERGDGVSLNSQHVDSLETILLADADRIESVAKENFDQCKAAMTGGGNEAWESWLVSVAGKLTEGECPYPPLDYTAFNYLSVNAEWQNSLYVCKGDHIYVHGTDGDYFQLQQGGPWINVAGDPSAPLGSELPCNIEGCVRGQLIMRFTSDSGVSSIVPIGIEKDYVVPEHGRIEVMINDDSLADNKFKVEKGLEHHTGIEVKPAGK